jgi:hypothetical protein
MPWSDVIAGFTDPIANAGVQPARAAVAAYQQLLPAYKRLLESQIG